MEVRARTVPTRELCFRAMGSDCQLIAVAGPDDLIDRAEQRVGQLESRWSRFIATSEVATLNAATGLPLVVSDDTLELVERSLAARAMTDGRFEPTVLGDVIRAGYDRSFERLPADVPAGVSDLFQGAITVIGPSVVMTPGAGFDPGGIGKGLAADIVCREMRAAGAGGACVNLGGDVRVSGLAPDGRGWLIAIEHPDRSAPVAVVEIGEGAVATSTSLLRRWTSNGKPRHHLIDPPTGQPAVTDLELVAVVAGAAWQAEVFAKAALLAGAAERLDVVAGAGLDAIAITDAGQVLATGGMGRFIGGRPIPSRLVDTAGART